MKEIGKLLESETVIRRRYSKYVFLKISQYLRESKHVG